MCEKEGKKKELGAQSACCTMRLYCLTPTQAAGSHIGTTYLVLGWSRCTYIHTCNTSTCTRVHVYLLGRCTGATGWARSQPSYYNAARDWEEASRVPGVCTCGEAARGRRCCAAVKGTLARGMMIIVYLSCGSALTARASPPPPFRPLFVRQRVVDVAQNVLEHSA